MNITVTGPDGSTFEFPEGMSQDEIRAVLDRHYTGGPAAAASRQSANQWAANKTGAAHKRSVWERTKDDFAHAFDTSWMAEGWRAGYVEGALGKPNDDLIPKLNPAEIVAPVVGAWDRMWDKDGAKRKADRMVAEARQRRQEFDTKSEADPFWKAGDDLGDKALHGAGAFVGTVGAAALDPVSYLTLGESLIAKMGVQATLAGGSDILAQSSAIGAGAQDKYSYQQTLMSGAAGAAFTGVAEGLGRLRAANPNLKDAPVEAHFKEELDAHDLINEPTLSQADFTPRALPAPEPKAETISAEMKVETPKSDVLVLDEPKAKEGPSDGPEAKVDTDPWNGVDWGLAGSEARAKAVAGHLDSLKKFIKPEQVQAFVAWLGKAGPGATEGTHWNSDFFDFEKLRSDPEQFFELHNALSDIFKPVYDEAGDAAKSWQATRDRIDTFGITMSDAVKAHSDITGEFGAAHKIHALETIAMQHTDNLYQSMLKLQKDIENGDFSGVGNFAAAVQETVLMDAMAAGAKSEIGRALNIMKMAKKRARLVNDIQGQMDALNEALGGKAGDANADKLKTVLGEFRKAYDKRGAAGLKDEIRKARTMGLVDYFGYAVVGNLLSNPATFMRNTVGNGLHAFMQIGERYVGAGVGSVRSVTPWATADRVTFREANAYAAGVAQGMHDALRAGAAAFRQSTSVTDGASSVEASTAIPFAITPERRARWRQQPLRSLPDMAASAYFSTVRTLSFRPMVAADEFYKTLGRRMQLTALATREAAYRSARVGGKESKQVFDHTLKTLLEDPSDAAIRRAADFFDDRVMDPSKVFMDAYRPNPDTGTLDNAAEEAALILKSIDIQRMAEDHARMLTFQNSGPTLKKWETALRTAPILKYLYVPFLRTPMLLTKAGLIDRNPVLAPFLTREGRDGFKHLKAAANDLDARLERGGAEADLVMSRMVVGAGILSAAAWLWANDQLVGQRTPLQKTDGVLPNSIKIGDQWIQITPLSPLAEPLTLVADLFETITEKKPDDEIATAMVGGVLNALINTLVQKGALAGLEDLSDLVYGPPNTRDETRGRQVGKQASEKLISALVPGSAAIRNFAQEQDPVMREARGFIETMQSMLPGWSEQLPARRDFLGRPIIRPEGQRGNFQAYKVSKETDDLMEQEFSRLAKGDPELDLKPPPAKFNGADIAPAERWRIAEVQGQLFKNPATGLNMEQAVRQLMFSEEYSYWPDAQRAQALKHTISWYRKAANWAIKNQDSEFYMAEMVRRTGLDKLEQEAERNGWDAATAAARGRRYGLTDTDAKAWSEIMQEPPAN